MKNLDPLLDELHTYIIHADKKQDKISSVSVGWHIEHILLAIIKTAEAVAKSNPEKYKWDFNLLRSILFSINKFPRGKGKAPESVSPKANEKANLDALYEEAKNALKTLKMALPNQYFKHSSFGTLNKKNTYIMLDIHIRHHLSIMKDITSSL